MSLAIHTRIVNNILNIPKIRYQMNSHKIEKPTFSSVAREIMNYLISSKYILNIVLRE